MQCRLHLPIEGEARSANPAPRAILCRSFFLLCAPALITQAPLINKIITASKAFFSRAAPMGTPASERIGGLWKESCSQRQPDKGTRIFSQLSRRVINPMVSEEVIAHGWAHLAMRIVLRDLQTQKFYRSPDSWTDMHQHATEFASIDEAEDSAIRLGLRMAEGLVVSDQGQMLFGQVLGTGFRRTPD